MKFFDCPLTGQKLVDFAGIVHPRKDPVRKFEFGREGREGLSITLSVPMEYGDVHKTVTVDVVCFNPSEFPDILKLKLKSGVKVRVFARKTDNGLTIGGASDVEVVKSI